MILNQVQDDWLNQVQDDWLNQVQDDWLNQVQDDWLNQVQDDWRFIHLSHSDESQNLFPLDPESS